MGSSIQILLIFNQNHNFMARRIKKEYLTDQKRSIQECEEDGYWLVFDESDLYKFQILVKAADDTPYEGAFFHFSGVLPTDYPFKPPKIKLLTTGNGRIRFNPNLYADGKVCLSILGTFIGTDSGEKGDEWMSSMTIRTICLSIRSLLNENPASNEPAFSEISVESETAQKYIKYVRYSSLKFAGIDHFSKKTKLPEKFQKIVDDVRYGQAKYESLIAAYKCFYDMEAKKLSNEQGGKQIKAQILYKTEFEKLEQMSNGFNWDLLSKEF